MTFKQVAMQDCSTRSAIRHVRSPINGLTTSDLTHLGLTTHTYPGYDHIIRMIQYWSKNPSLIFKDIDIQDKHIDLKHANPGTKTPLQAIGDIHGDLELTMRYLMGSGAFTVAHNRPFCLFDTSTNRIAATINPAHLENARYIIIPNLQVVPNQNIPLCFMGDYCDRGTDTNEVVATLLHAQSRFQHAGKGDQIDLLFGDHEVHFLEHIPTFRLGWLKHLYVNHQKGRNEAETTPAFTALKTMLTNAVADGSFKFAQLKGSLIFSHSTLPQTIVQDLKLDDEDPLACIQILNQELQKLGNLVQSKCPIGPDTQLPIMSLINHTSPDGSTYQMRPWPTHQPLWAPKGVQGYVIGHDHSEHYDQRPRQLQTQHKLPVLCTDIDGSVAYKPRTGKGTTARPIILTPSGSVHCHEISPT